MKIIWTTQEELLLCEEIERRRAADPLYNSLSFLRQVRAAQECLPAERRRTLRTAAETHKLAEALRAYQLARARSVQEPSAATHTSAPQKHQPSVDELLTQICEAVASKLAGQLEQALRQRMAAVVERSRQALTTAATNAMKRVVVIGTLDSQAAQLRKEFAGLLDIRASEHYSQANRAREAAATADVVVVWTNFASHSAYTALPREKIVFVAGGLDAVRAKLEEIYLA